MARPKNPIIPSKLSDVISVEEEEEEDASDLSDPHDLSDLDDVERYQYEQLMAMPYTSLQSMCAREGIEIDGLNMRDMAEAYLMHQDKKAQESLNTADPDLEDDDEYAEDFEPLPENIVPADPELIDNEDGTFRLRLTSLELALCASAIKEGYAEAYRKSATRISDNQVRFTKSVGGVGDGCYHYNVTLPDFVNVRCEIV